jgi:peptidylprolyl isomerase
MMPTSIRHDGKPRLARLLLSTAVVAAASLAPVQAAISGDGEAIARIGTQNVSANEVRDYIKSLDPRQQAAVAKDPVLLGQLVRQMLVQQLVLKEAMAKKWDQQPAVIARMDRLRDNVVFETYLESVSQPPADYPNATELQGAYDANRTAFMAQREFHVAQIFVAAPRDAAKTVEEAARKKLEKIERRLRVRRPDFAAVAAAESDDSATAKQGGMLPWLPESQIKPEIRSVVFGLAKDAISEPIRLDDGWHILKLLDTRPAHTRPLAEVKDQLTERLRAERAEQLRRAYLTKLLERQPVAINELGLSKLLTASDK